jgi:pre-mRNA-processing factor SLU7
MSLNITSETRSDRKQQRDIQEARQAGTIAPATDVVTGQIINPHNPEFITKRPWYLQDNNHQGSNSNIDAPSLQHQTNQRPDKDKRELTLSAAEELLQKQRQKEKVLSSSNRFTKGQWVEALKRNKPPYRICQVIKVHTTGNTTTTSIIDIQFEDGTIETKVKVKPDSSHPRVRKTVTGNRYLLTSTAAATATATAVPTNSNDVGNHNENGFIESFVSKRDQYHGYDLDQHNATLVRKYEQKNEIRRKIREKQQREDEEKKKKDTTTNHTKDNGNDSGNASDASDDSDSDIEGNDGNPNNNDYDTSDDEFVQRDEDDKVLTTRLARQGGVGGAQMKVTARNLRIREDTAKYLHNLDVDSAYYDPKSRSMRDNPHPQYKVPGRDVDYAGDNFIRISGDAVALAQQQLFAWDAAEKLGNSNTNSTDDNNNIGAELHPQANPSQVELLQKQFQGKVNQIQIEAKRNILNKYGGAEYLDGNDGLASAIPKQQQEQQGQTQKLDITKESVISVGNDDVPSDRQLRFGVSTQVEVYSRDGRLVTSSQNDLGNKRKALESKYEENIFINGHTTVWGSYFHKGAFTWGYSDDHSLLKNSYCTGMNGRIANDEANDMQYGTGEAGSATLAQVRQMLPPKNAAPTSSLSSNQSMIMNRSKLYGEVDATIELDEGKVQEALKRVQQQQSDHNNTTTKRKKYNSNYAEDDMTPEMMEAYRIQKINSIHDPMANFS